MTPDCLSHQVRLRQELLSEDSGGAKGGAGGADDSSPLSPPPPRADASAHHDAIAQHDAIHPVLGWSQPTSTGSALLAATPSATATISATTSAAAGGAAASLSQALGFLQEVRHLCMRPVARACKCSPRRYLLPTGDFACVVWRCAPELCWLVRASLLITSG